MGDNRNLGIDVRRRGSPCRSFDRSNHPHSPMRSSDPGEPIQAHYTHSANRFTQTRVVSTGSRCHQSRAERTSTSWLRSQENSSTTPSKTGSIRVRWRSYEALPELLLPQPERP